MPITKGISQIIMKVNRILFLHIPKTAGTTFSRILMNNYRIDKTLDWNNKYNSNKLLFNSIILNNINKYHLINGHISFGISNYLNNDYSIITILRNPVDRIISLYYFILRTPKHYLFNTLHSKQMSLEDFVRERITSETNNGMIRMLASEKFTAIEVFDKEKLDSDDLRKGIFNLKYRCAVVGIIEEFDKFILLAKHIFGWGNIYYTNKNVTIRRPKITDISYSIRRSIEKENELDIELYDYGKLLLYNKLEEYKYNIEKELMEFRKKNRKYAYMNDIVNNYKLIIAYALNRLR